MRAQEVRRLVAVLRGREGDAQQRRRLRVLVGGLITLLAAAAVAIAVTGGDPTDPFPTMEAGSRFGSDEERQETEAEEEENDEKQRSDLSAEKARRLAAGLFLVGFAGRDPSVSFFERLQDRQWGAVLVDDNNYTGEDQVTALVQQIRDVARLRGGRVPIVIAPQEGGDQSAFGDLPPKGQATLGAKGPTAVRRGARSAARKLAGLGIDAVLAPDAAVAVSGGAAEGRGFGTDPIAVTRAVRASVTGWKEGGVTPIVNSFPGEGAASQNPELGPASVGLDFETLRDNSIRAFNAVSREVKGIQMSPALYVALDPVTPATVLPAAVKLVRRDLDFDGAVVSADLVATTAAGGLSIGEAAVRALRAGCDLLYVPGGRSEQEEAYRAVVKAIRKGEVDVKRLRASLKRIGALRRRPAEGKAPGAGGGGAPPTPAPGAGGAVAPPGTPGAGAAPAPPAG